MFHGDEPLELILHAPEPQQLTIRPENNPREYNKLLDDWWDATENRYQQVYRQAEYPIVVENFLTATWARRLGREMPEPRLSFLRRPSWGDAWSSKLLANEAYQNSIERDLLLGRFDADEQATIKLPSPQSPNGCLGSSLGEPRATGGSPEARPQPPVNANGEDLPAPARQFWNRSNQLLAAYRTSASTCGSATSPTTYGSAISSAIGKATSAT